MKRKHARQAAVVVTEAFRKSRAPETSETEQVRMRIARAVDAIEIFDSDMVRQILTARQQREVDRYDEVWEGVYVVPPLARMPHQGLVHSLSVTLHNVVNLEGRGSIFPGANVSDRRAGWEHNYRCPDLVVVLKDSRAVNCGTHLFGGPDFLIEIESKTDETVRKIPFYSKIHVRELLIIHGETRHLQLYHHDGQQLTPVDPSDFKGSKWLTSKVLPLAFRRKLVRKQPLTEIQRTDDIPGHWTV